MNIFTVLWRELLMFIWVIAAVCILWVSTMYYKAIFIAAKDIISPISKTQNIETSSFEMPNLEQDILLANAEVDELLSEIKYRWSQSNHPSSIQDYMDSKLNDYEFSFNDLPPWRRILIHSIEVDAPIVDVPYASDDKLQNGDFDQELREWVVKYPFTAEPWDKWNSLIFWHSSVTAWEDAQNPFWYVFYKLQDLEAWEKFDVIWDGQLYSYQIHDKVIKLPKDVGAEIEKYDQAWEKFLTLMACYPRLTDAKRILVRAKQINKHKNHYGNILAMNN